MSWHKTIGALLTLSTIMLVGGCDGNPTLNPPPPPTSGFTVLTEYGAPGAYDPDPGVYVSGTAIVPYVCTQEADPNCATDFTNQLTNSAGVYSEQTDAVGGQIWDLSGLPSKNCASGYGPDAPSIDSGQQIPLICGDQTSYFKASPAAWLSTTPPKTVTYTATHAVFPQASFSSSVTLYSNEGTQQWASTITSTSQTVITAPVGNNAIGAHVIIFRNPSTNAVLGAGLVNVIAPPTNPCTIKTTNPTPATRC
jgi:hypothetical protein